MKVYVLFGNVMMKDGKAMAVLGEVAYLHRKDALKALDPWVVSMVDRYQAIGAINVISNVRAAELSTAKAEEAA